MDRMWKTISNINMRARKMMNVAKFNLLVQVLAKQAGNWKLTTWRQPILRQSPILGVMLSTLLRERCANSTQNSMSLRLRDFSNRSSLAHFQRKEERLIWVRIKRILQLSTKWMLKETFWRTKFSGSVALTPYSRVVWELCRACPCSMWSFYSVSAIHWSSLNFMLSLQDLSM